MTTTVEPPKEQTETAPPPRAPRPPRTRPRPRKDLLIGAGALFVLVVAAIVYALTGAVSGDDQPRTVAGPANAPFRVNVPNSWRTFTQAELSALPGDDRRDAPQGWQGLPGGPPGGQVAQVVRVVHQ